MLLAVIDAGGAAAASALFARVAGTAGEPGIRRSAGAWVLGAWGGGHSAGRDSSFVVEGRATVPESDGTSDELDRAAGARGDFALVGADADGLLLSSGGGGGYRPIYLAAPSRGCVIACTSLETLRAALAHPAPDPDVLAAYATAATMFASRCLHPGRTLYAGIERLPMYEAWHVDLDGRIRRRQTFRAIAGREQSGDPAELSRVLGDALRAAVQRAMSGHERVGVMASGGVDSSSLLAVSLDLARRGPANPSVDAFTWDYSTFFGDDRPHLRRLARHLGVEPVRSTPLDAAWAVGETFVADGMPLYQALSPLLATTGREARARGVTVLLNGAGGDDILDGDPCLFAQLARSGHPARALLGAARLRGPYMGGPAWRVGQYVVRPLVRAATPYAIRRRRQQGALRLRYPWAGPRLRRYLDAVGSSLPEPRPGLVSTPAARFEAMARSPYLFQSCLGRAQEEALSGCTRRDPFFDEEFMQTVASLPPLALMHRDFRRGLLREAMRDLVPDEVRWRETKSVMEPVVGQMVAGAGGFRVLEPLADVGLLADLGIAEPREFRRSFEALAADPDHGRWVTMWPALAAEAFLRRREAA